MAWIRFIEPDEASGALAELYAQAARSSGGRVGPMIRAGSRNVDALRGRMQMYRALMFGRASGLSRVERELIAVVTSAANGCHF